MWDLIVVDATSSGEVLPQLTAARSMRRLVRGGMLRSQVDFVDAMVTDHRKTALCITALPEEMPVAEALQLHDEVVERTDIGLGPCFLNRCLASLATPRQRQLVELLATPVGARSAAAVLGEGVEGLVAGLRLADSVSRLAQPFARRLAAGLSVPVLTIPLVAARPGLGDHPGGGGRTGAGDVTRAAQRRGRSPGWSSAWAASRWSSAAAAAGWARPP